MSENALILHPATPSAFDLDALLVRLRQIGLIGEPMDTATRHRPGAEFLQLITFLGCSPVIALGEPGATGDAFCYLETLELAVPQLMHGDNVKIPRCPHCRSGLEPITERLLALEPADCPSCGASVTAAQANWRQCAGLGRQFLVVHGIFEGEAVPSELLLQTLEAADVGVWHYFYLRGTGLPRR